LAGLDLHDEVGEVAAEEPAQFINEEGLAAPSLVEGDA